MPESLTINLPEIGDILLERSYRAKHINISVKPPAKVRVAVPVGTSFQKAEKVANEKVSWIKTHLNKYKKLDLSRIKGIKPEPGFEKNIHKRVNQLAKKFGFNYKKVTLRKMTTRWGSCTNENNISLNKMLYILPPELRDYIILHELLHTRIKNHGKEFWAELDRLTNGARRLHKTINTNYPLELDIR